MKRLSGTLRIWALIVAGHARSSYNSLPATASLHLCASCSCCKGRKPYQSSSFVSSTLVWFSPFLYSRGQSNSRTRGLWIFRRMRPGATTSFWNMTPFSTLQSSMAPPGTFSIFAYFLMSISRCPLFVTVTQRTASSANSCRPTC